MKGTNWFDVFSSPVMVPAELQSWSESFAYERAAGAIESSCTNGGCYEESLCDWFDLESAIVPLEDEVEYLRARHLLMRHPEHPLWVQVRDEGEPLPSCKFCNCDESFACQGGCRWATEECDVCTAPDCMARRTAQEVVQ